MRGRIATTALGTVLLLTLIYTYTPNPAHPTPIPGGYPYVKPTTPQIHPPTPNPPSATPVPASLIIKAKLPDEDLAWLLALLPRWRNQIITIDGAFARLHDGAKRVDSGRIAAAYLSWIVSNYSNLSETMVFVGPAQTQ
ncbi:hypothetical protein M3J09_010064 [Ascochyta lentis]